MLDTSITWTNEFLRKTSKWQFGSLNSEGTDIGTRLNTDLELLYDLTIDESTGECSCTVGSDCDIVTESYDLVQIYANVSIFHFENASLKVIYKQKILLSFNRMQMYGL